VSASAQGTYVSASLTGDVVRFGGTEASGVPDVSAGGEAIGFALRAGTRLGSAWGVEAEFARASEIERETALGVYPLSGSTLTFDDFTGSLIPAGERIGPDIGSVIFPPISYRVRTASRNVTMSAGLWARQQFSARVALVYTGGIGFHRIEREIEFRFEPPVPFPPFPRLAGVNLPSPITTGISYSARPFAGMEARVRMTDHLELVPGVRLHGLSGGLLVRPSVGLGWVF
jgi:hypothetical protein